jgi:hypothetical protein
MPGSDALHSALTGTNIHVPYRLSYADATAREAEAGAVPGDVGCLALQEDDNSLWMLTDDDPLTWVCVAQAGATEHEATINLIFMSEAAGTPLAVGAQVWVEVPFDCEIEANTALADQSGSLVVDIWKDSYANYPPTDADSITAAAPVTITSATHSQDTTLSGWTKSLTAGDILVGNIDSCTDIEQATISLKVTRS